jgi:hypothetical protein
LGNKEELINNIKNACGQLSLAEQQKVQEGMMEVMVERAGGLGPEAEQYIMKEGNRFAAICACLMEVL